MLTLRYYFKLVLAFLIKFKFFIFLSISVGVAVFFALNSFIKINRSNNSVTGITGRFHPDTLPLAVLGNISMGLTSIDDQKILHPAVAKSWETPDNGKTWIFKINTNLRWQDQTTVTSRNLNYEFSDVTIEAPDDETLIFKVDNNFAPFPSVVSKPTYKKGLIGIGNWSVDKLTLSGSYVSEVVLKNKTQKKTYRFYPTTESTKTAFKLGKIDIIENMLDPKPFDEWNTVEIKKHVEKNQVVTLFFNTKSAIVSEKEIRQALVYAIDKTKLGERAYSPIQPTSWAYNPQIKTYDYDLEKAKTVIAEAEKNRKAQITTNIVSSPTLLPIAEKIAKDWESAGVTVNLLVSSIIPNDYDSYLTIYDVPIDPDQYSLWHSTQTTSNISKYSNQRIDKLLEEGRSTVNFEERKRIYFDFQRFLLEDVPAVFLSHPTYYSVIRK